MGSLNVCWVFNCSVRKLRECLAEIRVALHLHLEATLLRIGGVETTEFQLLTSDRIPMGLYIQVVRSEERHVKSDVSCS